MSTDLTDNFPYIRASEYVRVLLIVATWFCIVTGFAFLALNRVYLKADDAYRWMPTERYDQNQEDGLVGLHARWDSNWYIDIANNGYSRKADDTLSNVVFFPMYPLVVRTVARIFHLETLFSGWFVSIFFCFLSCVYLYKIARKFHPEIDAVRAVVLLLIFPSAFFLHAVYTESLFLFLSLASFYYAKRGNFALSATFGFFASLTRITGLLLFLPLAFDLFVKHGFSRRSFRSVLWLSAIPLGTMLFFFYHWFRFQNFWLFLEVQSAWGRSFHINIDHFVPVTRAAMVNLTLDVGYLMFTVLIVFVLFRKKLFSYALYTASTLLITVTSGTPMSIGRYILVLFPIFLIGASIRNTYLVHLWIFVSMLLFALNIILFVNWYWAG